MEEFIKDRNEAFTSMDKEKIISYCNKYNITIPEKEEVFWAGAHKVRCNLFLDADTTVSLKQFNESYDWLMKHGYNPSVGGEE